MAHAAATTRPVVKRWRRPWRHGVGYLYVAPLIVWFLCFNLIPIVLGFAIGFTDWNVLSPPKSVGWTNYGTLLRDPLVWLALRNTLYYAVATVLLTTAVSLGLVGDRRLSIAGWAAVIATAAVVDSQSGSAYSDFFWTALILTLAWFFGSALGSRTEQARELWTFSKVNFARIAEDMGALGIRVEKPGEIGPAIQQAVQANRPVIIDVVTEVDALAPLAVS